MSDVERGPYNKALYDQLTAAELAIVNRAIAELNKPLPIAPPTLQHKARTLGFKLTRQMQPTPPPFGKRSLADVVNMIRSCVRRIQQAESECPTPAEYQAALNAEHEHYLLWQQMKAVKFHDRDGTWSMKVDRQKHTYQEAKFHRVEIGGRIIGTVSTLNRMYALIAGEVIGLARLEKESA